MTISRTSGGRLRAVRAMPASPDTPTRDRQFGGTDSDTLNRKSRAEHTPRMTSGPSASEAPPSDRQDRTDRSTPSARTLLAEHRRWFRRLNRRNTSIDVRTECVEHFIRWCEGQGIDPLAIERDQIDDWADHLVDLLPAVNTRRKHMVQVRQFYRWLVLKEYLASDPTLWLVLPKSPRRKPRPMAEDKYQRALELADQVMELMLLLAGMAGLRVCEIAWLTWERVDLNSGDLHVVGKGGNERTVNVSRSPRLMQALTAMHRGRGPVVTMVKGKRKGRAYRPNTLVKRINGFLHEVAGIPDTAHQMRHRFATVAYQASEDAVVVAELLGHVDLSHVTIYAEGSTTSAKAAVAAAGEIRTNGGGDDAPTDLRSVS